MREYIVNKDFITLFIAYNIAVMVMLIMGVSLEIITEPEYVSMPHVSKP